MKSPRFSTNTKHNPHYVAAMGDFAKNRGSIFLILHHQPPIVNASEEKLLHFYNFNTCRVFKQIK